MAYATSCTASCQPFSRIINILTAPSLTTFTFFYTLPHIKGRQPAPCKYVTHLHKSFFVSEKGGWLKLNM